MAHPAEYSIATDLVSRIRGGDSSGVEELYSALCGITMPALSRTVDSQLVQDRFHDVVVTILEAIQNGSLRQPAALIGFAHTITRRRVAAHIRGNISQRRHLVAIDPSQFPAPDADSPEAASIELERLNALRSVLRRLRPRDREILGRFYFNEETAQAICVEMGLTPTQFRLFKSRAVARCCEYLRRGVPDGSH